MGTKQQFTETSLPTSCRLGYSVWWSLSSIWYCSQFSVDRVWSTHGSIVGMGGSYVVDRCSVVGLYSSR